MDDIELAVKSELDRQAQHLVPRTDAWQAFQQRASAHARRRQWAAPALATGFIVVIAVLIGITVWSSRAASRKTLAAGAIDAACTTNVLGSHEVYQPGYGHGRLTLSLVGLANGGVGACLTYQQDNSLTLLADHPGILGADVVTFRAQEEMAGPRRSPAPTLVGGISAQTTQLKALGPDGDLLTASLAHSLTTIDGYRVFAIPLPPNTDPATISLQALASNGETLETVKVPAMTIPGR